MLVSRALTTLIVTALATSLVAVGPAQSSDTQPLTYEAFMALEDSARLQAFKDASAESKARLLRTNADRWFDENAERLSATQRELVEEFVEALVPDQWREDGDLQGRERFNGLVEQMQCSLWNSDFYALAGFHRPQPPDSLLANVWYWMRDCVIERD